MGSATVGSSEEAAVAEEIVKDEYEFDVCPVQLVHRTTSTSQGDKLAYPILQVVGGLGRSINKNRHNSSTSGGSSGTSIGSKSRKSSSESEIRPKSTSLSSSSPKYGPYSSGEPHVESERPSADSIKLIDQEEEDEIPRILLDATEEFTTYEEREFLLDDSTNSRAWSALRSSFNELSINDENEENRGLLGQEMAAVSDATMTSQTHDEAANEKSHSDTIQSRADSPHLGFHRIASDQLIFTKKKLPKIVGNYIFGDVLGEGSFGKVKGCLDIQTLCRRAVKILKTQRLRKILNGEANLKREIHLLRRLDNKHCIVLENVIRNEEKQKIYLVMEFCVGSLQEMLDLSPRGMFPMWQAHGYFIQLIEGLEYLHKVGVVHKDIKPSNLLLTMEEILKISDFGVAEQLDLYQGNDICRNSQGTPKFQAPEIAHGNTEFGGYEVDLWSSGVTLYNLISGQYPFDGETIIRLYENITSTPLCLPSNIEVDEELEFLLRGVLEKDPEMRMKINDIVDCDWFKNMPVVDEESRVALPALHGETSRPLTVYRCLEMLYDSSAVHSPHLSAEDIHETVYSHQQVRKSSILGKGPAQGNSHFDFHSSDEALSFAVSKETEPPAHSQVQAFQKIHENPEGKEGVEEAKERNGSAQKTDHGKYCRFKQRVCVIQ